MDEGCGSDESVGTQHSVVAKRDLPCFGDVGDHVEVFLIFKNESPTRSRFPVEFVGVSGEDDCFQSSIGRLFLDFFEWYDKAFCILGFHFCSVVWGRFPVTVYPEDMGQIDCVS